MIIVPEQVFEERIMHLQVSEDAKSYIMGVLLNFVKPSTSNVEIITNSVVLEYIKAQDNPGFHRFQIIADWLLWMGCMHPSSFELHKDTYTCIASSSYHNCWIMVNRSWPVFKELAEDISCIVAECKKLT